MAKKTEATEPQEPIQEESPVIQTNTKRRAVSVIRQMKLPEHVATAVLAEMGLRATSMVDPEQFKSKASAWLVTPASK